ncbi:MAG: thiamine pyrophosphate-dependent enzyme [Actinomycetota bacterium]
MIQTESIARVVALPIDLATATVRTLSAVGISAAFGVSGGGIGRIWQALLDSPDIETLHFRHEAGATFAAVEASLLAHQPLAVFCTTGPGITNTLTGLAAARSEGAKLVLLSARTSGAQRGRGAVQETPMPSADFFSPGWLFDEVFMIESPAELPALHRRLRNGFQRTGTYLAHVSVAVDIQSAQVRDLPRPRPPYELSPPHADPAVVARVAAMMISSRFALWVGHGARRAARQVRALADLTGAPVLATPRGKGVVAETHPQFLMVTGMGGHPDAIAHLESYAPEFTLVLGTRLGEPSSAWDPRLVPPGGFVHVDVDPSVPGTAFDCPVLAIQSDVGGFLDELRLWADRIPHRDFNCPSPFAPAPAPQAEGRLVRPQALFAEVQRQAADAGMPILVEPGGAMAWAAHLLKMDNPGQLRIVGSFGSMGHMACGVIGSALARGGPALCVAGDGSMLMNNEISTAVEYCIPAVWVVLNNSRYQMCELGMRFGPSERHARFQECDFARIARGMGARAITVDCESQLGPALCRALADGGPFLVDVKVDPNIAPPFESRFATLK